MGFFGEFCYGLGFLYKSQAKEDGVLGRDSGLPAPVNFRRVRTVIFGKSRTVSPQKELLGEEPDEHAISTLHSGCISYV